MSREGHNNQMTDAKKACLAIMIAIIAMIAASIFEDSDNDSSGGWKYIFRGKQRRRSGWPNDLSV